LGLEAREPHQGDVPNLNSQEPFEVFLRNQPNLYRQLKSLPWRHVPVQDETRDRGHGREEIRRLHVISSNRLDLPGPWTAPNGQPEYVGLPDEANA